MPPKVEYSLTPRGKSLLPYLNGLIQWAKEQMDNILDSYASDNVPILVGRFIIAIALCFTFPLYVGLLLASHAGLQRSAPHRV